MDNRLAADRCVLCLAKGTERYLFLFDDTQADRTGVLRQIADMACDKDLSLTWYDAACLSQRIGQRDWE